MVAVVAVGPWQPPAQASMPARLPARPRARPQAWEGWKQVQEAPQVVVDLVEVVRAWVLPAVWAVRVAWVAEGVEVVGAAALAQPQHFAEAFTCQYLCLPALAGQKRTELLRLSSLRRGKVLPL